MMSPSKFLLFYFSLVAVTILFFVSPFFLPKPQSIIDTVLLAPVVFFLWTHAFNPDFFAVPKWSPKAGALVLVFSILGIFTYFLSVGFAKYLGLGSIAAPQSDTAINDIRQSLNETGTREGEFRNHLESELAILKAKVDSLGARDTNVLGITPADSVSPTPAVAGQITAKDANLTDIPIYETASAESKVVGSAKYGINYTFSEKNDSWYKITGGWVEA